MLFLIFVIRMRIIFIMPIYSKLRRFFLYLPLFCCLAIAITPACAAPANTPEQPSANTPSSPSSPVVVAQNPPANAHNTIFRLEWTAETTFKYGQTIEFKLTVTNISGQTLTVETFPPYLDISLKEPSPAVVKSFASGTKSPVLENGKSIDYTWTWDQKDNGGLQVPAGKYRINTSVKSIDVIGLERYLDFTILPAEGPPSR
jgi:hypothetical protein